MSANNKELDFRAAEPTLEDELQAITDRQAYVSQFAGRVTSAAEVEESRQLALAEPLPRDVPASFQGAAELGYN